MTEKPLKILIVDDDPDVTRSIAAYLERIGCVPLGLNDPGLVMDTFLSFNPDLIIDVNKTQTNDGEPCGFLYHQAALLLLDTLTYIQQKSTELASRTVMP